MKKSTVPSGYAASEIVGGSAIEGSDVFLVNGQTRSKFYSSKQFIDDQIHGVTGSGIGVYMIIPGTGYESSSGGPFMRDINNQGGEWRANILFSCYLFPYDLGDQQELYYCEYSISVLGLFFLNTVLRHRYGIFFTLSEDLF